MPPMAVISDKALDPVAVGTLRMDGVIQPPHHPTHFIKYPLLSHDLKATLQVHVWATNSDPFDVVFAHFTRLTPPYQGGLA